MTIKQSDASIKQSNIENIKNKIQDILKENILNETKDIKEKLKNILIDLENVKFDNQNTKKMNGKIFNSDEIKELIIEASGYTKWSLIDSEILKVADVKSYKDNYGIDFNETEIHNYVFERPVNSRNDVNLIIVTAFPDLFDVEIHTGRAGYGLDGLVNKEEFFKGINAEFEI
jgi:copper chaperone CopZ